MAAAWITSGEAAARLQVSRRRVLRLLAQGRIPGAVKRGRVWLVPASPRIAPSGRRDRSAAGSEAVDEAARTVLAARRQENDRLRRVAQEAARRIAEHPAVCKVVLFGSVAAGAADRGSDIDLAVVADVAPEISPHKRLADVYNRIAPLGKIDLLVYTPDEYARLSRESPFVREEVVNRGVILFERR